MMTHAMTFTYQHCLRSWQAADTADTAALWQMPVGKLYRGVDPHRLIGEQCFSFYEIVPSNDNYMNCNVVMVILRLIE
jgi:hypothetical protein